jgi:flagellar L-ring protein precursor FlgH
MKHFPLLRWSKRNVRPALLVATIYVSGPIFGAKPPKEADRTAQQSPIDQLLSDTTADNSAAATNGSIYTAAGPLADLAMDFRATRVGDVVTVVVSEQASANTQGSTSTKRASTAQSSITSLLGPKSASGKLSNLLNTNTQTQLQGTGATSRQTTLSTTLSARVIKVLPNGNLIVEGTKAVAINSESQTVALRGIVRPIDIGPDNSIASNRVADLEVRINGRGVVNDAIHRPNALYRILLGILPF